MNAASNAAPDCAGRNGAHTPGPWHLSVNGVDATDDAVIIDGNGNEVLGVSEWCRCEEADARLIAAAPELLEALRAVKKIVDDATERHTGFLVADFQTATYPNSRDAYDGLCAAIAKAEGRS